MKNTFFSGLLLLCLLLAGCGGKKQAANIEKAVENTTDSNIEAKMDNDKSSIKSSDNTPTIGQVLHANYFDVTANKVSVNNKVSTGNEYSDLKQEEGNVYLVLNITFKNTDNESRTITAGTIWINYNGKDYSFDKSETIMVNGWGLLFEQINPLTSKTTNLVYKIPVEVKGDAYYQPGRAEKDQLIYLGKL